MKRKWKNIILTAAAAVGLCLALLGILAALNRRNQVVRLNQEIQYDDFAFSVLGARVATGMGAGESEANRGAAYYVVTMKVTNHARKVDYTLDKKVAILIDDSGREYHQSPGGQRALDSAREQKDECGEPIPAGASCTTEIVFELPPAARAARLRVSGGGPAGDILDTIFYGRKTIELR
ncbi:MAG TPA: DUF4352 domain-containing protein [Blastocatellia bacterium]